MDKLIDDIANQTKAKLRRKRLNEGQARYTQRLQKEGRVKVSANITMQAHSFMRELATELNTTSRDVIDQAVMEQQHKRPPLPPTVKDGPLIGRKHIYEWLKIGSNDILNDLVRRNVYEDKHCALIAILYAHYQSRKQL
ncbi:TPA: hypothetical protein ACVU5P_004197 [Vibrio parahaemolyticus]